MAVAAHQPVRTLHTDHLRDSPKHHAKPKRPSDPDSRAALPSLSAARPITLASLLEHPVEFVHATSKTRDDVVPYEPINLPKVSELPSSSSPSSRPPVVALALTGC